ncbi:MAG: DUF4199 domain-containing protein [Lachnoclostridium sp.]|nr:DUF4199 domain-containing protein [Lachnoclostridium sp.]
MSISPYKQGAEDGFLFGIYLIVMQLASFLSGRLPLLGLLSFVLVIAVPVVIYRLMVKYKRGCGGIITFSMLWMYGLVIFACAGIVSGLVMLIYLKWIDPDFLHSQVEMLARLDTSGPFEGMEPSRQLAENMLANNFIPRAIDVVIEIILLCITSGSLLSMLLAGILIARLKWKENRLLKR